MEPASGNSQDKQKFRELTKKHIQSLKQAYQNIYFVADSALYAKETLVELNKHQQLFITRVPQTLKQANQLICESATVKWEQIEPGYEAQLYRSQYGEVDQQWIMIRSQKAKVKEQNTLDQRMLKQAEQARKSFKEICSQSFACQQDADHAIEQWRKKQTLCDVQAQVIRVPIYEKKGRPKSNEQPIRMDYQIEGSLYIPLETREKELQQLGVFILATNDMSPELNMAKILNLYKDQQAVERGFRFLKSPDFLTNALYVKKPQRVQALLMVMTTCLLIYSAIEYKIRQALEKSNQSFPDMKKKPTQKPTAQWVFQCFQGIELLYIHEQEVREIVLNQEPRHMPIIEIMGLFCQKIYS